jgi:glucose/mannose-6-phosphate isomerase
VLRFDYPAQPRAAWAFGFFPLLDLLGQLGYAPDYGDEIASLPSFIRGISQDWVIDAATVYNLAKQIAQELHGRIPVVYGAGHLSEVARRWKGQLNENAKNWAIWDVLPEVNHNGVVGYANPSDAAEH